MRLAYLTRMPARTAVFVSLYSAVTGRRTADEMTPEQRAASRAYAAGTRPPASWVVGAMPRGVSVSQTSFTARDGYPVPVREYRPAIGGDLPVVVYLHGGGWVLGSPRGHDALCGFLADAVGARVVSIDYRLAPEHPAPLGLWDCVDAARWAGSSATRLAVCGDSAGANLATVACRVLRDEGGPQVAYQALIYPGTDATMSHPSVDEHAQAPVLTRADIVAYLHLYLDGAGLDPQDPLVSPLWADDLTGLPPALVQTADLDPLRDEGLAYADRLTGSGVAVRATNYLGVPHGFMSMPGVTHCGAQARLELATELRRALTPR